MNANYGSWAINFEIELSNEELHVFNKNHRIESTKTQYLQKQDLIDSIDAVFNKNHRIESEDSISQYIK